eukprot:CAMPEP_0202088448 /NCGR_PEP_ID=MMETSP0964-20121228/38599_1 /ASSEMBLY_ACC=CAM_ASM_000500 /TAXON_ID=4773 /ORGANISM="Schizochytrium aggregatum, Strain ATCC28209" /LENGTH=275 /DNA_ID=CAMNT_0048656467 /DNA_START=28 /DNA_END=855 /DNA_ORIENTATION=-
MEYDLARRELRKMQLNYNLVPKPYGLAPVFTVLLFLLAISVSCIMLFSIQVSLFPFGSEAMIEWTTHAAITFGCGVFVVEPLVLVVFLKSGGMNEPVPPLTEPRKRYFSWDGRISTRSIGEIIDRSDRRMSLASGFEDWTREQQRLYQEKKRNSRRFSRASTASSESRSAVSRFFETSRVLRYFRKDNASESVMSHVSHPISEVAEEHEHVDDPEERMFSAADLRPSNPRPSRAARTGAGLGRVNPRVSALYSSRRTRMDDSGSDEEDPHDRNFV